MSRNRDSLAKETHGRQKSICRRSGFETNRKDSGDRREGFGRIFQLNGTHYIMLCVYGRHDRACEEILASVHTEVPCGVVRIKYE